MPRLAVAALAATLFLVAPSAAHAASVSVSGGVLTYTAQPGATNDVAVAQTGPDTVTVTRLSGDTDVFGGGGGCTFSNGVDTCTGVTSVVANADDGNDTISAAGLATISATLHGGPGNDTLTGGSDDDVLYGDAGADSISGGDGIDWAIHAEATPSSYSLDGVANDGAANEGDNIASDVENIIASAAADGAISLTGDAGPNRLIVNQGKATIVGGAGADELEGGPQDDVIDARDGTADVVICGGGSDTVLADTVDSVSPTCEVVQRFPTPGGADDDHAPAIAWAAPRAGAVITGPTTLAVNATDDRGVAKVDFFAGGRRICEDTAAPFACTYIAHGGDIGRTTLVAVAFDGANQTATVWRAVTVRKFRARSVSLTSRPARDRRAPFSFRISGKVGLPAHVGAGLGCRGTVTVTARAGRRTLTRRRVSLQGRCGYRVRLRYHSRPAARIRVTARFSGNSVMRARSSLRRTLRTT